MTVSGMIAHMHTLWTTSWTKLQRQKANHQLIVLEELSFNKATIEELIIANNGLYSRAGDLVNRLDPITKQSEEKKKIRRRRETTCFDPKSTRYGFEERNNSVGVAF